MAVFTTNRTSGILFIIAGLMFFGAAALGRQVAFVGCGAMFVAIGASWLVKAKSQNQDKQSTE